ncbi:MAG: TVP38/TMEM64 family protein [Betaproteobacteria bacterium]|nr:TVP38/TMEM64 family protein [Betaproteobacteria bacterium]
MNKSTIIKLGVVAGLLIVGGVLYSQFGEYASLGYIQKQQTAFQEYYAENSALVLISFFIGYVVVTALSLPGAAIMTLLAGALFGLAIGVVVVSFASSMGATLAFLVARFILGESLQKKYGDKLKKINEGVEREGKFYLFTMRLIPAFPFFLINILMGLTTLSAISFYWVSQLGMLAGTVVFVFAGTQLAEIKSLGGILSPGLIAAFVALGVFPLAAKKTIALLQRRVHKDSGHAENSADGKK